MNAQADIVPLDNVEAEQAVLGTILLHNAAFDTVSKILEAEHFAENIHRIMFQAVSDMLAKGKGANPATIMTFLPGDEPVTEDMNVRQYVARLVSEAAQPVAWIKDTATAVYEMWLRRSAVTVFDEGAQHVRDLPPDQDIWDELGRIEEALSEIRARRIKTEASRIGSLYRDMLNTEKSSGIGVPIAFKEVRRVLSEKALEPGNLYGLLSSSGEGKTSLVVQLVVHALKAGHPVCIMSYDQSRWQFARQIIAQENSIEAGRQKNRTLSDKEWSMLYDTLSWIDAQPFEVVECSREKAATLVSMARQFIRRNGNGKTPLIIVDHILAVPSENERAHEGEKANQKLSLFKSGARDTDAAWLVLNQRSSGGMKRLLPRPILLDMYGGEQAIQPYDAIIYLFRWLKHYRLASATAVGSDHKKLSEIYPENVRNGSEDLSEIGALKVRFGDPSIRETLEFEARFTRYRSLKLREQPELLT